MTLIFDSIHVRQQQVIEAGTDRDFKRCLLQWPVVYAYPLRGTVTGRVTSQGWVPILGSLGTWEALKAAVPKREDVTVWIDNE